MISCLTIHGLRGFGEEKTIEFSIPNGKPGSGLTIMVGANNSGKTTIFEALRSFNSPKDKFIFDVGHQSYIHKILTGRKED